MKSKDYVVSKLFERFLVIRITLSKNLFDFKVMGVCTYVLMERCTSIYLYSSFADINVIKMKWFYYVKSV